MGYVFGPVPSRRLGHSLGVDPVPLKTCNWSCVYCQLGRTRPLTNERKDYAPPGDVVAEVRTALEEHAGGVDWITFAGSGEPTLHASLGRMIRDVKGLTAIPVAVLTNGALLDRPGVRRDLLAAAAVLPTLDAGSEEVYRRVNRPRGGLTFAGLVEGLVAFRREYPGRLWIEVMLVQGLNDSKESLAEIAAVLRRVGPDAVHVNTPVRPPAERWVAPPDVETVRLAVSMLGRTARDLAPAEPAFDLSPSADGTDAVLELLARHPMDLGELGGVLPRWSVAQLGEALERLRAAGRVGTVTRGGRRFWTSPLARYADTDRASRSHRGSRSAHAPQKVDPRTSTAATEPAKRIKQG